MAFALAMEAAAKRGEDGRAMLTSTLGAVLFTVLVVGGLTVPALRRSASSATSRSTAAIIIELIATRRDRRYDDHAYDERPTVGGFSALERGRRSGGEARGGRRDRSERGRWPGRSTHADGGGTHYGIDVRETFKFVDRQYITSMFTLEEGSRDAGGRRTPATETETAVTAGTRGSVYVPR